MGTSKNFSNATVTGYLNKAPRLVYHIAGKETEVIACTEKRELMLFDGNEYRIVPPAMVIYCKASDNYTLFYLTDKTEIVITKTLKHCYSILMLFGFKRVNQSVVINPEFVKGFEKNGAGTVKLKNGKHFQISKCYKKELLNHWVKV